MKQLERRLKSISPVIARAWHQMQSIARRAVQEAQSVLLSSVPLLSSRNRSSTVKTVMVDLDNFFLVLIRSHLIARKRLVAEDIPTLLDRLKDLDPFGTVHARSLAYSQTPAFHNFLAQLQAAIASPHVLHVLILPVTPQPQALPVLFEMNLFLKRHLCFLPSCSNRAQKCCPYCSLIFYCSREHQLQDWKEKHRQECHSLDGVAHLLHRVLAFSLQCFQVWPCDGLYSTILDSRIPMLLPVLMRKVIRKLENRVPKPSLRATL